MENSIVKEELAGIGKSGVSSSGVAWNIPPFCALDFRTRFFFFTMLFSSGV